jgi:hypothetical protein
MGVLARGIPNVAAAQCPHDADPRKHRRASERRDQDQGLHSGLPLCGGVLCFGRLVMQVPASASVTSGAAGLDRRNVAAILCQASMTPALLVHVRPEAFWRPRAFVITAHIAIAAGRVRTTAWAGVLTFPRFIWMVLAHPSAAIAE